jgi:hypothetical protein
MEEMMEEKRTTVIRDHLKAPRAGAIAGIVFSILFIISLVVIRVSVPANPQDAGVWLSGSGRSVRLALNLLPFAVVAFLWFMGVLRDRIGTMKTASSPPCSSAADFCFSPRFSFFRELRWDAQSD